MVVGLAVANTRSLQHVTKHTLLLSGQSVNSVNSVYLAHADIGVELAGLEKAGLSTILAHIRLSQEELKHDQGVQYEALKH